MFVHTIVYTILSIMAATAARAASMSVGKEPREEEQPPEGDKKNNIPLS